MPDFEYIDLSQPNDGQGDPLRTGGEKINNNFLKIKDSLQPNAGGNQVSLLFLGGTTYRVYAYSYWINGVFVEPVTKFVEFDITLPTSNLKWVVFWADMDGNIGKTEGAESANPQKPALDADQLYIGEVLFDGSGSTNITTDIVYDENDPGEFALLNSNSFDNTDTSNPYSGVLNINSGAGINKYINFLSGELKTANYIVFYVYLKSAPTGNLSLYLTNDGTVVFEQTLNIGGTFQEQFYNFNFNGALLNTYQRVTLNINSIQFDGVGFNASDNADLDIDYIVLLGGQEGNKAEEDKTLIYKTFEYNDGAYAENLSNYSPTVDFSIAVTGLQVPYFVWRKSADEDLGRSAIYIPEIKAWFDLNNPEIETSTFYAKDLSLIPSEYVFTDGEIYGFDFRLKNSKAQIDQFKPWTGAELTQNDKVGGEIYRRRNGNVYKLKSSVSLPYAAQSSFVVGNWDLVIEGFYKFIGEDFNIAISTETPNLRLFWYSYQQRETLYRLIENVTTGNIATPKVQYTYKMGQITYVIYKSTIGYLYLGSLKDLYYNGTGTKIQFVSETSLNDSDTTVLSITHKDNYIYVLRETGATSCEMIRVNILSRSVQKISIPKKGSRTIIAAGEYVYFCSVASAYGNLEFIRVAEDMSAYSVLFTQASTGSTGPSEATTRVNQVFEIYKSEIIIPFGFIAASASSTSTITFKRYSLDGTFISDTTVDYDLGSAVATQYLFIFSFSIVNDTFYPILAGDGTVPFNSIYVAITNSNLVKQSQTTLSRGVISPYSTVDKNRVLHIIEEQIGVDNETRNYAYDTNDNFATLSISNAGRYNVFFPANIVSLTKGVNHVRVLGDEIDLTPTEIKTAYESNPDTNVFTDAEKTKVDKAIISDATGIPNAQVITNYLMITQANYDLLTAAQKASATFKIVEEDFTTQEGYDIDGDTGQSNRVGRGGPIDPVLDATDPDIFQLARTNDATDMTAIIAADPLDQWDADPDTVGPSLSYAKAKKASLGNTNRKQLIVPGAKGGSGFSDNQWNPGDPLYNDFVTRMNAAMALGNGVNRITSITFQGGEKDYLMTKAQFDSALDAMILGFRNDITGAENCPVIVGRVPNWSTRFGQGVDDSIVDIVNRLRYTAYVSTSDLNHIGDVLHIDAPGARILGGRYNDVLASAQALSSQAVPSQVAGVTTTEGETSVVVMWEKPNPNRSAITDYVVQFRATGATVWQTYNDGISVTLSAQVNGLTTNQQYDFRVAAVNGIGQGPYSNVITATPVAGASSVEPDSIRHWVFGNDNPNSEDYVAANTLTPTDPSFPALVNPVSIQIQSGGLYGLQTDVADATAMTITMVLKISNTNNRIFAGNRTPGISQGAMAYYQGNMRALVNGAGSVLNAGAVGDVVLNQYVFLALTWDNTNSAYYYRVGAQKFYVTDSGTGRVLKADPIALGNAFFTDTGYYTGFECAEFIIFPSVLTEAGIDLVYGRSQTRMTARGISI